MDEDTAATNLLIRDKRMQVGIYIAPFFFLIFMSRRVISRNVRTLLFLIIDGCVHTHVIITSSHDPLSCTKNGYFLYFF